MDRTTARVVKKFAARIRKAYTPERIILFGSRARGDHFKTSDYDFIIVSEDFRGIRFPLRPLKVFDFWDWDVPLEVLCYTPDEFERKSRQTCIVSEALREGLDL